MLTGAWNNFDHLEENLSYPELTAMVKALREQEDRSNRMLAAVHGINLDENKREDTAFERIRREVEAEKRGVTEEVIELEDIGFKVKEI